MNKIDLSNPKEFTKENVAKLIGSKDDSQNRQIRVTIKGIAFLSDVVEPDEDKNLAFRLEILCSENGYTGAEAQKDEQWVNKVYKTLKDNWPNPSSEFIDY